MERSQAEPYGVKVDVRGMTCASCSARVQTALSKLPGVTDATVNFATDMALVRFADVADADFAAITDAIEDAGYDVADVRGADEESADRSRIADRRNEEARAWKRRFIVGAILTVPIMLLQMGPHMAGMHLSGAMLTAQIIGLIVLTGAVMLHVGRPYFAGALQGLRHRSANMDTLVALGSGVAFVYSTVAGIVTLAGGPPAEVFFDGAAMILTLISVGKFMEARAKGRAGAELEALLDLAAKTATVRRGDDWVAVPAEMVQPGDVVLVKPGEKVPTDGVVVAGSAAVDEALLTGESVPVTRTIDDEVVGGTINTDGRLEVRATKVGSETALAQIAHLVAHAQESKADAQRLADRVSAIFVPAIIVVAAVTFGGWLLATSGSLAAAVLPAVAVLIVACPCALGLATPTAIMVGTGRAAQRGIVIRDARALEQVRRLDAIVFDKTGTLTRGEMSVTDVHARGAWDEAELLRLAASLEMGSEHPIARAIVRDAQAAGAVLRDPADFASQAGHGVTGTIDGHPVRVGKPDWIGTDAAQELEAEGKTVVAVEIDGDFAGLIAVRDELKDNVRPVIRALRDRDVEVWMITGDNEATAAALAAEAGIDPRFVRARVAPGLKAAAVEELQSEGRVVAMVGDGVNDGPALATADLGIALGSGTDVAMQSADITLVSDNLARVLDAITISEATNRKIKQNLFWAFCYNTVLVPVAAFGFLIPMFAAAAMALSSVSVVTNSLLLRRVLK